ncbi:RES family NAD+ phosphorylase [candidate division KSB1 bacterium]
MKKHIDANGNPTGRTCSFCKTQNMTTIKPKDLFDQFVPLLDLYEKDRNGEALNKLIQRDWKIFAITKNRTQQKLLKAILINPDLFKSKYKPVFSTEQNIVVEWEKFREELKHRNRFFPKNAPASSQLETFGKYIGDIIEKGAKKFYRARIKNSEKPFNISDMKKPPKKVVTNGRANPIGIPYLYVASTIETAISEVRGHKGEYVTIAEFQMKKDLELADLRDSRDTISPFGLNDEDELENLYKNMPFLTLLGNELSKPIIPSEANLEYLPSQYLCEKIKHIGFHGIIYRSSIADGDNYVIFDDKKLKPVKTIQYQITDVKTDSKKIS